MTVKFAACAGAAMASMAAACERGICGNIIGRSGRKIGPPFVATHFLDHGYTRVSQIVSHQSDPGIEAHSLALHRLQRSVELSGLPL